MAMACCRVFLLLLLAAAGIAAAAAAAEPGIDEGRALIELATAMGAAPELLASWNAILAANGTLCGWNSRVPPCNSSLCGYKTYLECNETTGAINDM